MIERLSRTVGLISYSDSDGTLFTGTGTIIAKMIGEKEALGILITNKHVLPSSPSVSKRIGFAIRSDSSDGKGFVEILIPIFDSDGHYNKNVKFDPDGSDVAAIDITDFFKRNSELMRLANSMVNDSYFLRRDSLAIRNISIGEQVYFMGYPSTYFNMKNISPVLRTGVVATLPNEDYYFNKVTRDQHYSRTKEALPEKLTGFLIDASVYHGSSGSLVFTPPVRMLLASGGISLSNQISIIGIVTYSYFDFTSSVKDNRVNLGGVISADQIIKTLDQF